MDATKLHNVILDCKREEDDLSIDEDLTNLISQIQSNQPKEVKVTMKNLEDSLNDSIFNNYSISNYNILEEIEGVMFFGNMAFFEIERILHENSFNIGAITTEIQDYQKKRNEFLKTITSIIESFKKLKIEAHFYNNEYELGLLFPQNEKYSAINLLSKELSNWDKSIKTFREVIGLDSEDTKITFINNGSFEFFTQNPIEVATCISFTLERLFTLYKRILEIRIAREKLKELGVPKVEDELALKHEKNIYKKEIDSIVHDIFKSFAVKKIETGRLNELKVSVKNHLNYFAKNIDNGLIIEIIPPEIEAPEILGKPDTEENKAEKEKSKKSYEQKLSEIELIRKRTELAKEILGTGKEVFKLLASNDESEDSKDEE